MYTKNVVADVIWGTGVDETLGDKIGITIIATGFDSKKVTPLNKKKTVGTLGVKPEDQTKSNKKEEEKKEVEKTEEKVKPEFKSVREDKDEKKEDDKEDGFELKLIKRSEKTEKKESTKESTIISTPSEKKVVHTLGEEKSPEKPTSSKKEEPVQLFGSTDQSHLSIQRTVYTKPVETEKENDPEEEVIIERNSADRSNKLRELSMFRQEEVDNIEKEPAYMRKKYEPDNSTPSADSEISKYTLGEDSKNNPTIKSDNSFLHDNVD